MSLLCIMCSLTLVLGTFGRVFVETAAEGRTGLNIPDSSPGLNDQNAGQDRKIPEVTLEVRCHGDATFPFHIQCNECFCRHGSPECTRRGCPPGVFNVNSQCKGNVEWFQASPKCSYCKCINGRSSCANIKCPAFIAALDESSPNDQAEQQCLNKRNNGQCNPSIGPSIESPSSGDKQSNSDSIHRQSQHESTNSNLPQSPAGTLMPGSFGNNHHSQSGFSPTQPKFEISGQPQIQSALIPITFENDHNSQSGFSKNQQRIQNNGKHGSSTNQKKFQNSQQSGSSSNRQNFQNSAQSGSSSNRQNFQNTAQSGFSFNRPKFQNSAQSGSSFNRPNFQNSAQSGSSSNRPKFQNSAQSGSSFNRPKFQNSAQSGSSSNRQNFQNSAQSGSSSNRPNFQNTPQSGSSFNRQKFQNSAQPKPHPIFVAITFGDKKSKSGNIATRPGLRHFRARG